MTKNLERTLRFEEDDQPIKFYIHNDISDENQSTLIESIRKFGGEVLDSANDADYQLASAATQAEVSDNLILPVYIKECIEEDQLLDKSMYKHASLKSQEESAYARSQKRTQRNKYTAHEDEILARYVSNPQFKSFKAPASYEELARKYPQHTVYSWRERALKRILPEFEMNPQYKQSMVKRYWSVNPCSPAQLTSVPVSVESSNIRKRVRTSSEKKVPEPKPTRSISKPLKESIAFSSPEKNLASFVLGGSPAESLKPSPSSSQKAPKSGRSVPATSKSPERRSTSGYSSPQLRASPSAKKVKVGSSSTQTPSNLFYSPKQPKLQFVTSPNAHNSAESGSLPSADLPNGSFEPTLDLTRSQSDHRSLGKASSRKSAELDESDVLRTAPDSFLRNPVVQQKQYESQAESLLEIELEREKKRTKHDFFSKHSVLSNTQLIERNLESSDDETAESRRVLLQGGSTAISGTDSIHDAYVQQVDLLIADTQCSKRDAVTAMEMAQGVKALALQLIRVQFNYMDLEEDEKCDVWMPEEDEALLFGSEKVQKQLEKRRGISNCEKRRKWIEIRRLM